MQTPKPLIHVDVDGEQKPVFFGQAALWDFCDALGIEIGELQRGEVDFDAFTPKQVGYIFWAGFKHGHRKENKKGDAPPFEADIYEVGDWLDLMSQEDTERIMGLFASSMGHKAGAEGKARPKAAPKKKAA